MDPMLHLPDHLIPSDHPPLAAFRRTHPYRLPGPDALPLDSWRENLPFREELWRAWERIPTTCRADLASHLEDHIPQNVDYSRLIHYTTSGTTGPPLVVPSHPLAIACQHTLIEPVLAYWGLPLPSGPEESLVHLAYQASTWTYTTRFSIWNNLRGFKLNLNPAGFPPDQARAFFLSLNPTLITGTPASLAALLAYRLPLTPRLILSGATTLSLGLKKQLEQWFSCPVVDWYSTTETGPVAWRSPRGFEVVAPDIWVELLDSQGRPVSPGERGEITVSGGRNPFLPMIRYRTGDTACWRDGVLIDLDARAPQTYQSAYKTPVSTVDLGRVLFAHTWARASFNGHELVVEPVPGVDPGLAILCREFAELLGRPIAGRPGTVVGKGVVWTGFEPEKDM